MAYIGQEPGQGTAQRSIFTAVAVTDTVTADDNSLPLNYTVGQVSVYLNGVKQVVGDDVVASNGSTLVFASDYAIGDVIEVIALSAFSPADTVPATGGSFTGQVTLPSPVINTGVSGTAILDEDAMGSDSATKLATQQSIKAYVDAVEGTAILSTGVTGTSKYLRVDGDDTSSWQTVPSTLAGLTDATVSSSDPVIASNPSAVGHYWINSTSGEAYICTDATIGSNVWTNIGQGTGDIVPPIIVDFLVIAGGGGGGHGGNAAGGAGAGGYRGSYASEMSGGGNTGGEDSLSLSSGIQYTMCVGPKGIGSGVNTAEGGNGGPSSIEGADITDITTVGGGGGGSHDSGQGGNDGGSGGGKAYYSAQNGSGTEDQGFAGGGGGTSWSGGGGGGAKEVGEAGGSGSSSPGAGGDGLESSITGSSVTRAGGGGGNADAGSASGGAGGGSDAGGPADDVSQANSGSGGGGGNGSGVGGGDGGDGVVIIRMADGSYSGTTTGSPTVTTGVGGTDTVLIFNGDGTYTA